MAAYASARMDEEDQVTLLVPKQAPKWRRVGLVVGLVCAIAAVVGVAARPRQLTTMQKARRAIQLFKQGWHSRKLGEDAEVFEMGVKGSFLEEGQEGAPDAMTIRAVLSRSDAEYENTEAILTFQANDGQGEALKGKLEEIHHGIILYAKVMGGDQAEKDVRESVALSVADNLVEVRILIPAMEEESLEEEEAAVDEGIAALDPSFTATLTTGRNLKEMFDVMGDSSESLFTLPGGISLELSTHIAAKLIAGVGKASGMSDENLAAFEMLAAFHSAKEHFSLTYKKDELNAALNLAVEKSDFLIPPTASLKPALKNSMRKLPDSIARPMHGIEDLSQGVKSFVFRDKKEKMEVNVGFENFLLGSLLKALNGDRFENPEAE